MGPPHGAHSVELAFGLMHNQIHRALQELRGSAVVDQGRGYHGKNRGDGSLL